MVVVVSLVTKPSSQPFQSSPPESTLSCEIERLRTWLLLGLLKSLFLFFVDLCGPADAIDLGLDFVDVHVAGTRLDALGELVLSSLMVLVWLVPNREGFFACLFLRPLWRIYSNPPVPPVSIFLQITKI